LKSSLPGNRVTRLGEFSHIGRLFALSSFFNYKIIPHLWAPLVYKNDKAFILANMYWATFWAIFSQTHLVALPGKRKSAEKKLWKKTFRKISDSAFIKSTYFPIKRILSNLIDFYRCILVCT
jgi:hypothetical protein